MELAHTVRLQRSRQHWNHQHTHTLITTISSITLTCRRRHSVCSVASLVNNLALTPPFKYRFMSWSIVGWDHVLIRIDFRLNWMWNYVHLSEHFTPWSGESLWSFPCTDFRYLCRIQRIAPFSSAILVSEGVARPLSISITCQRRFCWPSWQSSLSRPLTQHIKYLMAFHFLQTEQRKRNQS